MFLAVREIRRNLVRFALLAVAVALLLFLVLFQQALQDSLVTSFVGAIRNLAAPVLVYNVDGQQTLQASVIAPDLEEAVAEVDGVAETGRLMQRTFTVRIGDGESTDAAIIGSDTELGHPREISAGRRPERRAEAIGSSSDFAVGDEVLVVSEGDGATTLTVVGLAEDAQLSVTATLFTDLDTYRDAVIAANPDASEILPNALVVQPGDGVDIDELVERINATSTTLDAYTRQVAADTAPGVAEVRQSFRVIFLLYGLVVPLVVGLFFLIVTLQKAPTLTLLRAAGARASVIGGALVLQAVIVLAVGLAVGIGLWAAVAQLRVGGLSLRFEPTVVTIWSLVIVGLGLASSTASLRRVLRIDPVDATRGRAL